MNLPLSKELAVNSDFMSISPTAVVKNTIISLFLTPLFSLCLRSISSTQRSILPPCRFIPTTLTIVSELYVLCVLGGNEEGKETSPVKWLQYLASSFSLLYLLRPQLSEHTISPLVTETLRPLSQHSFRSSNFYERPGPWKLKQWQTGINLNFPPA